MLKLFTKYLLIIFTAAPLFCGGQNCGYNYLGTKTLYTAPVVKTVPPPAGYSPVFINYVGRHGARHLTKEVNTSFTYAVLGLADAAGGLTPAGKKLKLLLGTLNQVEHGQVKSISGQGRVELAGIGERLLQHYPAVFKGAPKIKVGITKEIRTKQSAEAFLTGLKKNLKDSSITLYTDDIGLRFYDASPAYTTFETQGSWQPALNQLQQKLKISMLNNRIVSRWFTPAYIKTFKPGEADKLVNDLFGCATIAPSLKAEVFKAGFNPAEINFAALFTCDELTALSKVDVADDYLKKGPGADINGIQVKIAAPLLVDFVNAMDIYINHPDTAARLRFAHAETVAPFAALLGINTASVVTKDLNKLDAAWQSAKVIPLSANIQWIVYKRKATDPLLVKVLLNEVPVHINGLTTNTYPYYNWTAMRKFYLGKLTRLHVALTDDMAGYLKKVE